MTELPKTELFYRDIDPLGGSSLSIHFDEIESLGYDRRDVKITFGRYAVRVREICFVCTALMLFVVCVLLSVFLVASDNDGSSLTMIAPDLGHRRSFRVLCERRECLRYAAFVTELADFEVDPCEDIYSYACSGAARTFRRSVDDPYVDMLDVAVQNVDEKLRAALEADGGVRSDDRSAFGKVRRLYESCRNGGRGSSDRLLELIETIGGWELLGNWIGTRWDSSEAHAVVAGNYSVSVFFEVRLRNDVVEILKPTDYDRIPLRVTPRNTKERAAFLHLMWETAMLLIGDEQFRRNVTIGDSDKNVGRFIEDVESVERNISAIAIEFEEIPVKVKLKELKKILKSIDLSSFLRHRFVRLNLTEETLVKVHGRYFTKVSHLIETFTKRSLHNFLFWRFVFDFVPFLRMEFRKKLSDYYRSVTTDPYDGSDYESSELDEECLNVIKGGIVREAAFGLVVGRETDNERKNRRILQLINDLVTSIELNLKVTTPSSNSKPKMVLELENQLISNATWLDVYYEKLEITTDYLTNNLNMRSFKRFLRIDSSSSRIEFRTKSISASDRNRIRGPNSDCPDVGGSSKWIVSYELTLVSFVDPDLPKYVLYGTFGTVLARSLLRKLVDCYGSNVSYGISFDTRKVQNETSLVRCLSKIYFQNSEVRRNISSREVYLSLIERGALLVSFEAYLEDLLRNDFDDVTLKGLQHLSNVRSFFLSASQIGCEDLDPVFRETLSRVGIYSQDTRQRIYGTLRSFVTAFNCSVKIANCQIFVG